MYEVIPLNRKILLKKAELEKDESEKKQPTFYSGDMASEKVELFEVIKINLEAHDLVVVKVGDLVTVDHYQPIGKFNDVELFVTDGKSISTKIRKIEV